MPFDFNPLLKALDLKKAQEPPAEVRSVNPPTPEELEFLKKTAMLESSDGADIDHKPMTSGIQKGYAAVGKYGQMPNSLHEMVNRAIRDNDPSPKIQNLKGLSPDELAQQVALDPDLEQEMAIRLLRHIKTRPGISSDEQANYMWQHGHNLTGDKLKARKYDKADRSKKFKKLKESFK